jgi:hypothetical protein
MRIKKLPESACPMDCRRVHVLLKQEGFRDNHRRDYWLYRDEGLSLSQAQQVGAVASAQTSGNGDESDLEHGFRRRRAV